ncbi:MAG TPA: hypothetical protein VNW04_12185 [Puia sp.]|jgi:hypothetical protein|nr:hypothetical protein [Puia sp.]
MDIAPDGVILSTCSRFAALLKRRNIPHFLESSLLDDTDCHAGKKSYLISSIRYVRDNSEQLVGILESITDGFFVLDQQFKVTLCTWQSFHEAFKKKMTVTFEQYHERTDQWLEMSLYPPAQGVFAYFKEVTLRKKQEALLALDKKVRELNTAKRISLVAMIIESKKAEVELNISNERYTLATRATNDAIWDHDRVLHKPRRSFRRKSDHPVRARPRLQIKSASTCHINLNLKTILYE